MKYCWIINIDALVLNNDGNLSDCLSIATRAALFNTLYSFIISIIANINHSSIRHTTKKTSNSLKHVIQNNHFINQKTIKMHQDTSFYYSIHQHTSKNTSKSSFYHSISQTAFRTSQLFPEMSSAKWTSMFLMKSANVLVSISQTFQFLWRLFKFVILRHFISPPFTNTITPFFSHI